MNKFDFSMGSNKSFWAATKAVACHVNIRVNVISHINIAKTSKE